MALTAGRGEGPVQLELEPEHQSVRRARGFVNDALVAMGCDERADDAALLTSELATNAVIHARTNYVVTVACLDGLIRVEVADASPASVQRRHFSATSGTGRGIGLVDGMALSWGVDLRDGGKVVWFELTERLPGESADRPLRASASAEDEVDVDLDALLERLGGWEDPPPDSTIRDMSVLVPA